MIRVEGLTKYYGDYCALDDVSFNVQEGEILGFLGPNGAGKTTTMRILTGYMPPTEGLVTIAGLDVFSDSLETRRMVGYLPETVPLYPEMTVRGYLDFMAAIRGVADRAAAVERALSACAIEEVSERIIAKLSKGYRQRVGLAQALVHNPKVLVLDEPTIGLDPRQILAVRELIHSLGGEHTIILSTHILPEVSQVCDRVMIINRGRLVAEDTTENLTSRLQGGLKVRLEVANPGEGIIGLLQIPGVRSVQALEGRSFEITMEPGQDVRAQLAERIVQGGYGLLEMQVLSMSLEEIFLHLTTQDEDLAAIVDEAGAGQTGSK